MSIWTKRKQEIRNRFRGIAENLLNLEINTIITTRMMTARKAPAPAHTLLDIAYEYEDRMTSPPPTGFGLKGYTYTGEGPSVEREPLEKESERSGETPPEAGSIQGPGLLTADERTFRGLYWTARRALEAGVGSGGPLTPSQKTILTRIRKSSVEIAAILERLGREREGGRSKSPGYGKARTELNERTARGDDIGLGITDEEWLNIRKIWEIGVEEITMQTVIQLDGDVVTRIHKDYESEGGANLWKAHLDGVRTAMDSWRFLVTTIGRFVSATINLLRQP